METTSRQVEIRELIPSEGMWLTQAEEYVQERTFSKGVFLGENDSAENWKEVDDDYKASIEQAQQTEIDKILAGK